MSTVGKKMSSNKERYGPLVVNLEEDVKVMSAELDALDEGVCDEYENDNLSKGDEAASFAAKFTRINGRIYPEPARRYRAEYGTKEQETPRRFQKHFLFSSIWTENPQGTCEAV